MTISAGYDVLAIGAHPDDVEAACGGWLAQLRRDSYRVAICDLTRGELGTNGTVEVRAAEAAAAARVLGSETRLQLGLPDGAIDARDPEQLVAVVRALRTHRPRLVVTPHEQSRHPDHSEAAALVRKAVFFTAVPRFAPDIPAAPRPVRIRATDYWPVVPSFVVDVSATLDLKLQALRCYRSQFELDAASQPTHLNDAAYLQRIETDARHYGRLIGAAAGEGFVIDGAVPLADPVRALAPRAEVRA